VIVVFTSEAKANLEAIAGYIALENPSRATSFVQELVTRCETLADMPRAFPWCRVMNILACDVFLMGTISFSNASVKIR
jgi:plasmid stabilization system protein ParE